MNGTWQQDDNLMEGIVMEYFPSIFRSQGPTNATAVVDAIQPKVSEMKNVSLTQELQTDEVSRALK